MEWNRCYKYVQRKWNPTWCSVTVCWRVEVQKSMLESDGLTCIDCSYCRRSSNGQSVRYVNHLGCTDRDDNCSWWRWQWWWSAAISFTCYSRCCHFFVSFRLHRLLCHWCFHTCCLSIFPNRLVMFIRNSVFASGFVSVSIDIFFLGSFSFIFFVTVFCDVVTVVIIYFILADLLFTANHY